jgi:molybdopterin/thiamine biosynthesis adenylyltransferase
MTSTPLLREIYAVPGLDVVRRLDRAARMPTLVDVPGDAGAALRKLDLVIVGTGSVGLRLSDLAARSGVRSLLLVDPARFKPESLLTHPCFPQDVGRPKAIVSGERARSLSPETRVLVFQGGFEELPTHVLAGASFVLLASDNLRAEVDVSQRALELGLPIIQASVYGPTLTAQVRAVASGERGEGPCLACGFNSHEWAALDRGTRFSCAGDAGSRGSALRAGAPTASLPHLCGIAADLAFIELTRRAVGITDAGESRIVDYQGYTHKITSSPLVRRPECPLEHARSRLLPAASDLGATTPRAVLRDAGYGNVDPRRVTLGIEGHRYLTLVACRCDKHERIGCFVADGASAGTCARCGVERKPHPLHVHEAVPVKALERALDRTLSSLGAPGARTVRVRGDDGVVCFHRSEGALR